MLAEKGDSVDAEGRQWLKMLVADSERMLALIDDLLAYSRVDASTVPFDDVALDDVMERTLLGLQHAIRERDAQLDIGPLPVVRGVESQLVRVLQNVLANALKYCEGQPKVRVRADQHGETWRITVQDNGIGIRPGQREQAFELFARLVPRSRYPGTGLGLAVSRKIIERHGGTIAIAGTDDATYSGCNVVIELPLCGST